MRLVLLACAAALVLFAGKATAADGCPGGRCSTLELRVVRPVVVAATAPVRVARRPAVRAAKVTKTPLKVLALPRACRNCR